MKFLEVVPGPLIIALIEGLLALVDTNVRQYFSNQPWLPVVLAILGLLATLFNTYIKPKITPPDVPVARGIMTGIRTPTWLRLLIN